MPESVPKKIIHVKNIPNNGDSVFSQRAVLISSKCAVFLGKGGDVKSRWQSNSEAAAEQGRGGAGKS